MPATATLVTMISPGPVRTARTIAILVAPVAVSLPIVRFLYVCHVHIIAPISRLWDASRQGLSAYV
jgi:hypothetical protein